MALSLPLKKKKKTYFALKLVNLKPMELMPFRYSEDKHSRCKHMAFSGAYMCIAGVGLLLLEATARV